MAQVVTAVQDRYADDYRRSKVLALTFISIAAAPRRLAVGQNAF